MNVPVIRVGGGDFLFYLFFFCIFIVWCTEAYNVNYGTGIERSAKTRIATFCNCKKVAKLNDDGEVIKIYDGLTYAAKDINRDYSAISSSIKRGGKCAGYFWKFV